MKKKVFALLFLCLSIVACDSTSTEPVKRGGAQKTETSVYFPDGGGVDFGKTAILHDRGEGWEFYEYVLEQKWSELHPAVSLVMKEQGYVEEENKHPDFNGGAGFVKKGGKGKKVFFRYKNTQSVSGEKILLRVSWYR